MTEPSNAEQATWSDVTRDYVCDLQIEIERLREVLTAILPYVATQSVGCHGDKCREIWCYSCNGEHDANFAAMAGAEAYCIARAALQPKEGE